MEDKIKKQSIDRLNISVSILERLKQNNIIKIEDKCSFFTYLLIVFNELSILHWIFFSDTLYLCDKIIQMHLKLSNKFSFYIQKKYNDNLKKILYNNKRNFNKGV